MCKTLQIDNAIYPFNFYQNQISKLIFDKGIRNYTNKSLGSKFKIRSKFKDLNAI